MKIISLTVLACSMIHAATAQKLIPAPQSKYKDIFLKKFTATNSNRATLVSITNGNKIYALPQDKMICLVPDINTIAAIPNATPVYQNSSILNGLKKEEIVP